MTKKRITRTLTYNRPTGTEMVKIREMIRDTAGNEHPNDKEIEVPTYTVEQKSWTIEIPSFPTEKEMLAELGDGCVAIACEDTTEMVEG